MSKSFESERNGSRVHSNVDPTTDFSKISKSDASITSQLRGAGKGDNRRPASSEQQLTENWCRTFGHKFRHGTCINGCGAKEPKRGKDS